MPELIEQNINERPLPFAEVDRVYKFAQRRNPDVFGTMTLQDFARYMNQNLNTTRYSAGDVGGTFATLLRASDQLNRALQPVAEPLARAGGAVGGLFGQTGREVGEAVGGGLPRAAVDVGSFLAGLASMGAPFPGARPLGLGLMGLGLGSTFLGATGETGSKLGGGIAAGTTALMPGAAMLGRGLAARAIGRYGPQSAGILKRLFEEAGVQLGVGVEQEIGAQVQSRALTGEFFNPLDPRHIGELIAGQLPFFVFDAPRIARGYRIDYSGVEPRIRAVGLRDVFRSKIEGLQPSLFDALNELRANPRSTRIAQADLINQGVRANREQRVTRARTEAATEGIEDTVIPDPNLEPATMREDFVRSEFNQMSPEERASLLELPNQAIGLTYDELTPGLRNKALLGWDKRVRTETGEQFEFSVPGVTQERKLVVKSKQVADFWQRTTPGATLKQLANGDFEVTIPVAAGPRAAILPSQLIDDTFFTVALEQTNEAKPFGLKFDREGKLVGNQLLEKMPKTINKIEWAIFEQAGIDKFLRGRRVEVGELQEWLKENGPKVEIKRLEVGGVDLNTAKRAQLAHELEVEGYEVLSTPPTDPDPDQHFEIIGSLEPGGPRIPLYDDVTGYSPAAEEAGLHMIPPSIRNRIEHFHDLFRAAWSADYLSAASERFTFVNPIPVMELQAKGGVDIVVTLPGPVKFKEGLHFPDAKNPLGFVRGYFEPLPGGDKVFHVFEVQSDWAHIREVRRKGSEVTIFRSSEDPALGMFRVPGGGSYFRTFDGHNFPTRGEAESHLFKVHSPLLADYNRILLKTAMKHAIDKGASHVAVSDAQTAMLTEGMDLAAVINSGPLTRAQAQEFGIWMGFTGDQIRSLERTGINSLRFADTAAVSRVLWAMGIEHTFEIRQERGMRLNYDQELPRLLKELTGSDPQEVRLGRHQNVIESETPLEGEGPLETLPLRDDLFLRNPDGTLQTHIGARMFSLGKVRDELLARQGFTIAGKDKISNELTQLESEGATPEALGRAAEALSRTPRKEGETIADIAAREVGLNRVFSDPTTPGEFLVGVRDFFHRYFDLKGQTGARRDFLTRVAVMSAAMVEPRVFGRTRLAEAIGGPSFASPPVDPKFQGIVALRTSPILKSEMDMLRVMWDAAHEYTEHLGFAAATSPQSDPEIPSVREYRKGMEFAKQMDADEKSSVINTLVKHAIPQSKGEFDYKGEIFRKFGDQQRPDIEASEFLADYNGLLIMGLATKEAKKSLGDYWYFSNKDTQDLTYEIFKDITQSWAAVKDLMEQNLRFIGRPEPRVKEVMTSVEGVHQSMVNTLRTSDQVQAAYSSFSAIVDRVATTAANPPPQVSLKQIERFFRRLRDPGEDLIRKADVPEGLLGDAEQMMMPQPRAGGKRLHWWEHLYPLTQLARTYPELKPMADLALDFGSIASNSTMKLWELFQNPTTGKFDKERLIRISDMKKPEGRAFTYVALLQQVEERQFIGRDLNELLRSRFPGMTEEQIRTVDLSIRQAGDIAEAEFRMLVKANVDNVAHLIGLMAIHRNPAMPPSQAWRLGKQYAETILGNLDPREELTVLNALAREYGADIHMRAVDIGNKAFEGHKNLIEKLGDRPWYFSEVRPGKWIVAWKPKDGPRHLESYKTQKEAQAVLDNLNQRAQTEEFDYIKHFNRDDSAERWRGMQDRSREAFLEADTRAFNAAMAHLKDVATPELLRLLQEEFDFKPGDGALRLVTPPYMQERALVPGREQLNMAEQLMTHIDAVSYGTAKRFTRQQMQLLLQAKELKENPALANTAIRHMNSVIDPTGREFTTMKNFIFTNFLGFNFSSNLVELTQTFVTAVPELIRQGAKFGEAYKFMRRAWFEVGRAYLRRGPRLKKDRLKYDDDDATFMVDQLEHDRVIERGWIQELFALEDAIQVSKRSLVTGSGKNKSALDLIKSPAYHVMKYARDIYGFSVRFNARVSALAGYRFAREVKGMDHENAMQFARDFVRVTNFGGGRANRPTILTGLGKAQGVGGVMYALSGYSYNLLAMMARLAQESFGKLPTAERAAARRAFATMLGTQGVLGGAMGLPLIAGLIPVLEQLFPEVEIRKNLRQALFSLGGEDEDLGHIIADGGMSGLFNVAIPFADIGSRFHLGNLLGVDPYQGFTWGNLFGPATSMVENYMRGSQKLLKGDVMEAAEGMVPAGVRGWLRLANDGGEIRDTRDRLIFTPTPAEKWLLRFGFKPKRLNQYYEEQSIKLRSERIETERLHDFHTELAKQLLRGETEEVRLRLLAEAQETDNYSPTDGLRRVVQIAQDMSTPRDPSRSGLRTTAAQRSKVRRMFPSIEQPSEVNRLLQRKLMERSIGLPGAGQIGRRSLTEAMLIDQVMSTNPHITRDEARQMLRRVLRPRDAILSGL